MKSPKVSLIIPVFNKQKKNDYLKEAIDSALAQVYKNLEIIVVNDGSDDDGVTHEIALSYGNKITYLIKENGGVSSALNLAIENMSGEYFSWLSHDDVYLPNKIYDQIEYLNKNNLIGSQTILYSDYELIDKDSKHISFAIKNTEELNDKPEYGLLRGAINGLTLLIPKAAFEEHGKFDESLRAVQDYDLWYKFYKNYNFVHVPEVLVKSRYHSTQVSHTSPLVLSEGNEFWLKMIVELDDKRKIDLEGSLYNFYKEMALFLKQTPYDIPLKYCNDKIREIKEDIHIKNLTDKVDIIIPFLNREEETIRALETVLKQTYKNYNVLLINDGSTDDLKKLKEFIKPHKNIELVNLKKNIGAAAARNKGMDLATGEYIAFLDSDDEWVPEKLEKQLINMKLTNADFSHTSYDRILDNNRIFMNSGSVFGFRNNQLIYNCPIATPTVMLKLKFLNDHKFRFNPDLTIGEDTTFWLTMLKETPLFSIDEPLAIVNAGTSSAAYNIDKQILGFKTILTFLLNDEYYSKFDYEISRLMDSFVQVSKIKYKNLFHDPFAGGFFKRNTKKLISYTKNEGFGNTLKRIVNKVKRKISEK